MFFFHLSLIIKLSNYSLRAFTKFCQDYASMISTSTCPNSSSPCCSIDPSTNQNNVNKRWRKAFAAIYFSRAICSLFNEIIAKKINTINKKPNFSNSQSCSTVIDIEPDRFFSNVDQTSINKLVKEKDMTMLLQFGGVHALTLCLQTDAEKGINGNIEDIARRHKVFGYNTYHKLATEGFSHFMLISIKDPTVISLFIGASLSLSLGIKDELKRVCFNGGSIFVTVLVVIVASSVIHFWPNRQFKKLLEKGKEVQFEVVRNGQKQKIPISDVVVGDVVSLRRGSDVPADGLLMDCHHSLKLDDLSMPGIHQMEVNQNQNPFLFSGTKVKDGYGQMLVTSVGKNTRWGEIMSLLGHESHKWRPQNRARILNKVMRMIGVLVASLLLVVLTVRFFTAHIKNGDGSISFTAGKTKCNEALKDIVGILVTTVVVASSAMPEGFPFAVAMTVSYSMRRMLKSQALVRRFAACQPIASTTTICTDTTGILTLNQMNVKFWLGHEEGSSHLIEKNVQNLLCQGIGLLISQAPSKPPGEYESSGTSTEEAIFNQAIIELGMNIKEVRESCTILYVEALSTERKRRRVLVRKEDDQTIHVHQKGQPDVVLALCSHYYETDGTVKPIDIEARTKLEHVIQVMAHDGFKSCAFAHKQLEKDDFDDMESHLQQQDGSLTLLGMMGVRDQIRPGVRKAIDDCKQAGVNVKVITGEDVLTAKAIASECGILGDPNEDINGEFVVEAFEFQNYTAEERIIKVDKIRVMAGASYSDRLLFVECLKQNKGNVVAVTGNGPWDAPILLEADVGIFLGFHGNNAAVENSDIVILNNGFESVATVLKVGRCCYENVQTFIQYLLTANIASLVSDIVSTVSGPAPPLLGIVAAVSVEVPYAVLQILWVKLIIGTLAALSLIIEKPNEKLMQKPPLRPEEPLITNKMCRSIMIHAVFQISVLLTIQFKGQSLFAASAEVRDMLIFNTFVLFQVFTVLNARKLEKDFLRGIRKKKLFWGVILVIIILQVVMVEFLTRFASMERLSRRQWGFSVGIAFISWPIGWIGSKYIPVPNKPFLSYLKR